MKIFKHREDIAKDMIYIDNPNIKVEVAESIHRLRDTLLLYNLDDNKKVIAIESSISGESKTTIISNVAVSLAQSGKKVALVDLDLRKSRVHQLFNIENVNGLREYMLDQINYEDLIKPTKYENLMVINRGSQVSNFTLILTSNKLKDLVEKLKETYDFILFDCPPVLVASDFIPISKLCDGVIFAVAYGRTKKKYVVEAIKNLKMNNANLIGAVFTFFDPKKSNGSYDNSYYNYYGYGKKNNIEDHNG